MKGVVIVSYSATSDCCWGATKVFFTPAFRPEMEADISADQNIHANRTTSHSKTPLTLRVANSGRYAASLNAWLTGRTASRRDTAVQTDAPGSDNDGSRSFSRSWSTARRLISEGSAPPNKREEGWRHLAAN